jgi:hypothetical protein
MEERPDHPHQAAVHLMKALRCCKDCYDVSEGDLLELQELEYRKQLLAEELRGLNYKADAVFKLKDEVRELEVLVGELRAENEQAQTVGVAEIDRMGSDRLRFENEQREGMMVELTAERTLTHELTLEMESLLERVKSLNRVNNELIYNFCSP